MVVCVHLFATSACGVHYLEMVCSFNQFNDKQVTVASFFSFASSIYPHSLTDTLGCLHSKTGGYNIMSDGESESSSSILWVPPNSPQTSSSTCSSAVDKKEAKSIEEKPLLSDTGTDVDKDLSATVNHDENNKTTTEDCEVEKMTANNDTKNSQEDDKDEKLITEDSKGTTKDTKDDDVPSTDIESSTTKDTILDKPDDLLSKSGRDWDGEQIKREYVPTPRPKLLATPRPFKKPPPGACFFKEVSWHAILEIEYEDPFEKIKLFSLVGVEKRPITLKDVPAEYRPYEGCIFVSISHTELCRLLVRG